MEKPISLIIEETKDSLTDIINNCRLHPAVIEMIVKDVYMEICRFNAVNAAKEKEQYTQESTAE